MTKINKKERLEKFFQAQFEIAYNGFMEEPLTMKMLSIKTGIDRANLCRYVSKMREAGTISLVRKSLCKITGFSAGYYSTDPELFVKQPQQLKLL